MKTGTTVRDASGSIRSLKKTLDEQDVPIENENSYYQTKQAKTIERIAKNLKGRKLLTLQGDYGKTRDLIAFRGVKYPNKYKLQGQRKRV